MSSFGRRVRAGAVAVAAVLLLYGTVAGSDDVFPFGPFSMYSGRFPATGVISSNTMQAVTADGRRVPVTEAATGFRRAEMEGQLADLVAHPGQLARLAAVQQRRHPGSAPYVEVRIVQRRWQLLDGAVVGAHEIVLADWHASAAAGPAGAG